MRNRVPLRDYLHKGADSINYAVFQVVVISDVVIVVVQNH